jgi:hypothetical protein
MLLEDSKRIERHKKELIEKEERKALKKASQKEKAQLRESAFNAEIKPKKKSTRVKRQRSKKKQA